ncbi:MAG: recombinase family protein [Candidatus Limiplasma sp.]|nr:recombinase family protein [Candidatus Limiplasma sp.]
MRVGYARVSTKEQNEARQIQAFKEQGIEKVFLDKQSGKSADRPELKAMLAFVRHGDVVVVESISRAARNTRDLLSIVEEINNKGAEFVSLKENIDTQTATGKFMLTVFAAMAELEREYILQRQAEGIAIAKAEGRFKGKPKMQIDNDTFKRECKRWRNGEQTATAAMNKLGLKPNTFYRRVKELGL